MYFIIAIDLIIVSWIAILIGLQYEASKDPNFFSDPDVPQTIFLAFFVAMILSALWPITIPLLLLIVAMIGIYKIIPIKKKY